MAEAVIGLGSNLGDGPRNLWAAWERLGAVNNIQRLGISSPYRSAPVGMRSRHWFTNAVARIRTDLEPRRLLEVLLAIEAAMGRRRQTQAGPSDRIIDLDLLCYGELIINSPGLVIPHPEIEKRLFVLAPLAELLPAWQHPVSRLAVAEMLSALMREEQQRQPAYQVVEKMSWVELPLQQSPQS